MQEFIKRNGQFTVNIGLCEGQTPVLGVVFVPALPVPKMYFGVKSQGAYAQEGDGAAVRIRCQGKCLSQSPNIEAEHPEQRPIMYLCETYYVQNFRRMTLV